MRCPRFEGISPVLFWCDRIFCISFIDQSNWNVMWEPIMPFTIKMLKKMFLQTSLPSRIFFVIAFVTVPTISETICRTTKILFKTSLTCQKMYQGYVVTVKAMINFIWHMVTVLVNVSISDTMRHIWHLLPWHLQDFVLLSIEYILALTK